MLLQQPITSALLVLGIGTVATLVSYSLHLRREKQGAKSHYTKVAKDFEVECQKVAGDLSQVQQELGTLKQDQQHLEERVQTKEREAQEARTLNPAFKRLVYNVAVIGASTSGKTALINKLVDPCFRDITKTKATTTDQTDKTVIVSLNVKKYMRTEHVLRFYEWGGEYLVKAQNDMLNMCRPEFRLDENGLVRHAGIQAAIFVVDLAQPKQDLDVANPDKHEFNQERINRQIRDYFSYNSIRFLLNERILPYLQVVILFVNKIDRLNSNHFAEMETLAKDYYKDLIMGLRNGAPTVEVIVGSAYTEASLHRIFSTLAEKILPADVWEGTLRAADSGTQNSRPPSGNRSVSPVGGDEPIAPSRAAGPDAQPKVSAPS